nr:hypothetical protein [Nanoarchaeota archaeon]
MRNILLRVFGLAIVLLFITSCVPLAKYYVCPDGSKVLDPDKCILVEEKEEPEVREIESVTPGKEPEEEEEHVPSVISAEAQELFARITNVNSLQYSYVESPMILPKNIYYTSRDKMKIELRSKVRFTEDESYDTVYLDLIEKTGVAYCEDRDRSICPDRDKVFDVDFDDYFIETPFDWLAKVTSAELTGKSKTLEQRNAKEVSFWIGQEPGVMFLDSFFGVPLQITFKDKNYEF